MAKIVLGMADAIKMPEYNRRGPTRSSSAPIRMRAGTVRARLHNVNVVSCAFDRCRSSAIAFENGAKLNHTTKLMKNAPVVRCRMRADPLSETSERS